MNVRKVIAVAALGAATLPAFADQLYPYVDFSHFQGTKSRAKVTQELKASHANGDYVVGGREYVDPAENYVSSRSRAQLMAELKQSKADRSYALMHEGYAGQIPMQGGSSNVSTRLARSNVGNATSNIN